MSAWQPPPRAVPSAAAQGRDLFRAYCASCHGVTGEGNGPAAGALRQRPADLTMYTVQNGGTFPTAKLQRIVDGRDVMAHGSSDMPVWGNAFRASREGLTEQAVRSRIEAIVQYVESIQARRG
jgi:mono/diheme cytochrome c family protein